MFFKAKCIGIDFGSKNIKAALIEKTGNKWYIHKLAKIKNPLNTTFVKNEKQIITLSRSFQELIQPLKCKKIVIGVPSKYVTFRNLQFPKLPWKELREAVYWESREFSSVLNYEYICDFQVVMEHKEKLHVLLAAVDKELITNYLQIAKISDHYIQAIDVYPLAKARILQTSRNFGTMALLDIGSSRCEIIIFEEGNLIINKSFDFEGGPIKKLIKEHGSVSLQGHPEEHFIGILTEKLQYLINDISRVFDLFCASNKNSKIPDIVLSGCIGNLWYLKIILKDIFKVRVITENELHYELGSSYGKNGIDFMKFSSSIGFAMRGC